MGNPWRLFLQHQALPLGAGEVLIKHQLSLPGGIFKLATGYFQGRTEAGGGGGISLAGPLPVPPFTHRSTCCKSRLSNSGQITRSTLGLGRSPPTQGPGTQEGPGHPFGGLVFMVKGGLGWVGDTLGMR